MSQIGTANAAASSNVTLSGTQTIDSISLSVSDVCLATAQTTASQNGPWVVQSSAWTRPAWYASSSNISPGAYVEVQNGSTNGPSLWMLKSSSSITVDSTASTWVGTVQVGGDIGGHVSFPTVTGIQGEPVATSPSAGDFMVFNGSQWVYKLEPNTVVAGLCTVALTSNTTLSGTPFIDGVGTAAGSIILCTAQTNSVENGPWQIPIGGGSWQRPIWYATGATFEYGALVFIGQGTAITGYLNTFWKQSSGAAVIDTDPTTWDLVQVSLQNDVIGHLPLSNLAQTAATSGQVIAWNGSSWAPQSIAGTGTVTSVALTVPSHQSVSGSPITGSGTLAISDNSQSANTVFAGPTSGGSAAPAFRALVATDLPAPFSVWSSSVTYSLGNVAQGSDNNLYRSIVNSNAANDPTTDIGTNWELWYLRSSVTLNCGSGQRFAGSSTDPAGIQQAVSFIQNACGAASPSTASATIQIANNGTITVNNSGVTPSTTQFGSATLLNVGTSLLYSSGTAGNTGKSCRVTAVTGPSGGVYTYTVDNGGGSTGLSAAPATSDVFTADYGYGTNPILINLPIIGPNLIISGSTSTATVPLFFPAISDGGTGGSFAASPIYVAYTYTWSAGGATQETVPGFVQTFTPTLNHKITLASFTVPTGVSGVNVYISTSLNGPLSSFKKQASSFSVSGGVAAALTLTSNNTGGATPPTVNPVAAAYPSALTWASSLNTWNIDALRTPGFSIGNIYLYGNLNANSGNNALTITECPGVLIGPNFVMSSFGNSAITLVRSSAYIGTTQVDNSNSVNYNANGCSYMTFTGNCCSFGGAFGYVIQFTSQLSCSNAGLQSPTASSQIVAYRNTTGFQSQWGGQARIQTVTASGEQTWNNTTTYSPSSGSVGNHNGYLEVN